MKLVFSEQAWDDYLYWQKTDRATLKRINDLIRDAMRDPTAGLGKPEPLRHALQGYWSRRIDREHRSRSQARARKMMPLWIAQMRYHY